MKQEWLSIAPSFWMEKGGLYPRALTAEVF